MYVGSGRLQSSRRCDCGLRNAALLSLLPHYSFLAESYAALPWHSAEQLSLSYAYHVWASFGALQSTDHLHHGTSASVRFVLNPLAYQLPNESPWLGTPQSHSCLGVADYCVVWYMSIQRLNGCPRCINPFMSMLNCFTLPQIFINIQYGPPNHGELSRLEVAGCLVAV